MHYFPQEVGRGSTNTKNTYDIEVANLQPPTPPLSLFSLPLLALFKLHSASRQKERTRTNVKGRELRKEQRDYKWKEKKGEPQNASAAVAKTQYQTNRKRDDAVSASLRAEGKPLHFLATCNKSVAPHSMTVMKRKTEGRNRSIRSDPHLKGTAKPAFYSWAERGEKIDAVLQL